MNKDLKTNNGFTIAEILITLGIIGTIAMLTMPGMIQNAQEQIWISGATKFYAVINQALLSWKNDTNCFDDSYTCLLNQGLSNDVCSNFDQIGKFLSIIDSTTATSPIVTTSVDWLPDTSYSYGGVSEANTWGGLSNDTYGCKYRLKNGMILKVDPDTDGFNLHIDVNGKKSPNRIGKDIYTLFIGKMYKNDLHADLYAKDEDGLCSYGTSICTTETINPGKNNGATPLSYVLLYKKIPDFYK